LSRFTELRRLDLSENLLRKVPKEVGQYLPHLQEFDLNGNPIEDVHSAVDSLCTLSSLRGLRINLHEESQVDYLLRSLEGLEELNGLAVERDALFNEDEEDGEQEQAIQDVTEEEQFEDANDFVHPSNIVLEESNEDGTISVDNYG